MSIDPGIAEADANARVAIAGKLVVAADQRARHADGQRAITVSQLRAAHAELAALKTGATARIAALEAEIKTLREQSENDQRALRWKARAEERAASRASAGA